MDGGALTVESYRLYPIDDSIDADRAVADQIDQLKKPVTAAVFASRGYSIDQPLAVAPRDLPNTFTDIAAGTPLANLVTDAFRIATQADIGFTANGMMRASLLRGKSGVLTVYDVFAVAPRALADQVGLLASTRRVRRHVDPDLQNVGSRHASGRTIPRNTVTYMLESFLRGCRTTAVAQMACGRRTKAGQPIR